MKTTLIKRTPRRIEAVRKWSLFNFRIPFDLHVRMRAHPDINWTASLRKAVEEILKQAEAK